MRKIHRLKPAFLIIGISLVFAFAPAYAHYNAMTEADFLARGAKIEAGDIADLLIDKQINVDFVPSESFVIDLLEMNGHGFLIIDSFQITSIAFPFSVLRC